MKKVITEEKTTKGTASVPSYEDLQKQVNQLQENFNQLCLIVSDIQKKNDKGYRDFLNKKNPIGFKLNK